MAELVKENGATLIMSDLILNKYGFCVGFAFPWWSRNGKFVLFSCRKIKYDCGDSYSLTLLPISFIFCVLED